MLCLHACITIGLGIFHRLFIFLNCRHTQLCCKSLFPCLPVQESAVTACVTRSTVLMVASALRVVLTATSACVHSGSREISVKKVSQHCFGVPLHNNSAFYLLTDAKEFIFLSSPSHLSRFLAVLTSLQRDGVFVRSCPLASVFSELSVFYGVRGDVPSVGAGWDAALQRRLRQR